MGGSYGNKGVKVCEAAKSSKEKLKAQRKFIFWASAGFLSIHRSFRRVHGGEHHGPRGDRGGDGEDPAAARGPGSPRV